jgi:hypothetical protein
VWLRLGLKYNFKKIHCLNMCVCDFVAVVTSDNRGEERSSTLGRTPRYGLNSTCPRDAFVISLPHCRMCPHKKILWYKITILKELIFHNL